MTAPEPEPPSNDNLETPEEDASSSVHPSENAMPLRVAPYATLSLWLSLLSFVTCGLAGIPSLIFAFLSLRHIRASEPQMPGKEYIIVAILLSLFTIVAYSILIFFDFLQRYFLIPNQ